MKACKPKTLKSQVIRGIIGFALLVACALTLRENYALSFLFLVLAFIPLRGCPACWTVETAEVLRDAKAGKNRK